MNRQHYKKNSILPTIALMRQNPEKAGAAGLRRADEVGHAHGSVLHQRHDPKVGW
jgi:hypothetical protein